MLRTKIATPFNMFLQKKWLLIVCSFVLILQFILLIFFQRGYFLKQYDNEYWKDRYEHSQWQLPMSKRIIGDDGLYLYTSYLQIQGSDPTSISPEVPPMGKYLIGLFIIVFKSAAYYGFFIGLFCLVLVYLITKSLLKSREYALLSVTLIALDPLFFSQLWNSWLDIAQLFFLLLSVEFFILSIQYRKRLLLFIFISGISLGFFTEVKFAVFTPIIGFVYFLYLLKVKQYKSCVIICISMVMGIFLSYTAYFIHGHNIFDFIKLQKYIISFYGLSKLSTHYGSLFQIILFGKFQSINSNVVMPVKEWTFMWVVIFINYLFSLYLLFKKKSEITYKGILLFCFLVLVTLTFIPSYPRYLLILLPFFYMIFTQQLYLVKYRLLTNGLVLIILIGGLWNFFQYITPTPDTVLQDFSYNLSNGFFQDIYEENIIHSSNSSRNDFRITYQTAWDKLGLINITIKEKRRKVIGNTAKIFVQMNYITRQLGSFSEEKIIRLNKQNEQWKVVWAPSLFLNGYDPHYNIVISVEEGKRGSILDEKGSKVVEDTNGSLVMLNPDRMDKKREFQLLNLLEKVSHIPAVQLQNTYLQNTLPNTYVSLFSTFLALQPEIEQKLKSFPGLKLTSYPSRIYKDGNTSSIASSIENECCTRIYSSSLYHGVSSYELKYDKILSGSNGGQILIKDHSGKIIKEVYKKEKKDGKDVIIN